MEEAGKAEEWLRFVRGTGVAGLIVGVVGVLVEQVEEVGCAIVRLLRIVSQFKRLERFSMLQTKLN